MLASFFMNLYKAKYDKGYTGNRINSVNVFFINQLVTYNYWTVLSYGAERVFNIMQGVEL